MSKIDPLDARTFTLKAYLKPERWFEGVPDPEEEFTQRDLRLLLKHVEGRSNYLTDKIKGFIKKVDDATRQKTNWDAEVPKTPVISICSDNGD